MASDTDIIISSLRTSMNIELPEALTIDQLKNSLAAYINSLINTDFNKLITLLYRIDINESRLKQLLNDNSAGDAGGIITELIIERQLQKIQSRKENKNNSIIPEDDKW